MGYGYETIYSRDGVDIDYLEKDGTDKRDVVRIYDHANGFDFKFYPFQIKQAINYFNSITGGDRDHHTAVDLERYGFIYGNWVETRRLSKIIRGLVYCGEHHSKLKRYFEENKLSLKLKQLVERKATKSSKKGKVIV